MTDEKDYGKMRVTYEVERTWNNFTSDEAQAKAIAESYLAPHGWKITSIEVGLTRKDEKLIEILESIMHILRLRVPDNKGHIPSVEQKIEQLRQIMTIIG